MENPPRLRLVTVPPNHATLPAMKTPSRRTILKYAKLSVLKKFMKRGHIKALSDKGYAKTYQAPYFAPQSARQNPDQARSLELLWGGVRHWTTLKGNRYRVDWVRAEADIERYHHAEKVNAEWKELQKQLPEPSQITLTQPETILLSRAMKHYARTYPYGGRLHRLAKYYDKRFGRTVPAYLEGTNTLERGELLILQHALSEVPHKTPEQDIIERLKGKLAV